MTDHFFARDALGAVSQNDLLSRVQDGLVTVLDVRPEGEFAVGHLPGALNACAGRRLLPGPVLCPLLRGSRRFAGAGYRVHRLDDGYPEWKVAVAGLPTEAAGR